jgi:Mor family transcriptional regulator
MIYRNSDMADAIDEYVHNQEHRKILKSRFIDGLTYDELSNKYNTSVRQLKRIIYKYDKILIKMAQKRHV